ncbi:hypothetical protein QLQ85_11165 [Halomonas sp. M4R5S39]|uniref:hypothetical protein n=1 Tax=Halomonas kalidii TaxID=3043293 RepID=UPI0024A99967|nr:hypothetical protein [Halomonas kalidii]MDI5985352.1 hypothetical protein [Halomonas kalidii]
MAEWNLKDGLEALAYLVGIVGGLSAAFIYFQGVREESISVTRKEIARAWTNEGGMSSNETFFVTLELENSEGDLIGSLATSQDPHPLEVHADIGWFSTKVHVSRLLNRSVIPVAKVNLELTGNNNRLEWTLVGTEGSAILPKKTVLWPSPVGVSR